MYKIKDLYGKLDPIVLATQASVAEAKLNAIHKVLSKLQKVPLEARDEERINAVIKAREFNKKMLKEANER